MRSRNLASFLLVFVASAAPLLSGNSSRLPPEVANDPAVKTALAAVTKAKADVSKAMESLKSAKLAYKEADHQARIAIRESRKAHANLAAEKNAETRKVQAGKNAKAASDAAAKAAKLPTQKKKAEIAKAKVPTTDQPSTEEKK
ncbi:hypothetical protein [Mesoterricola silvestris]|uniref:hypothetical protein n=1 Tax=Mesoterricola silvestris TaxID=2927979 RepID=UPI0029316971|nr:hypothetical protein [Mesoterricola silvestris]